MGATAASPARVYGGSAYASGVEQSAPFAPLLDVSNLSIGELRATADPALDRALQRLLASLDDPNGVISAFGSFIADS